MFKFEENDIISNTVVANPRFRFSFYNGVAYVNEQDDNGVYGTGSVYVNDLNVLNPAIHKIFTNLDPLYANTQDNYPITSSALIPFEIKRDFIKKTGSTYDPVYTTGFGSPAISSIAKFISLKNSMKVKEIQSPVFKFNDYITETSNPPLIVPKTAALLQDLTIFSLDDIFCGSLINPGSIDLKFYKDGELLARARDTRKNGELIEQTNSTIGTGSVVGFALYEEGIIVLTDTASLGGGQEYFQQPTASAGSAVLDDPKWIHFGSYIDVEGGVATAITGSSYIIDLEGTKPKQTITMMAYAPKNKLNWSNNPTFLDASTKNNYINNTSSFYYEESQNVLVKNVVSSSFSAYSASFVPTTYIRTIGIYDEDKNLIAVAKVANPVKKTTEQDYTFKLKLDL